MSSFVLYLVGFLLLMGGLVWAAIALGVPGQWVAIGAVVLLGIGVITAVTNTRAKDETAASDGEPSG
ncbi:MAG: hypothetical protein WA989_17330 [Henriciella sp.]|uniref:hypothetical protein n=1 Tax=Henriciella sp. TaxID=1968823 RepID=UPI003C712699